HDDQQQPDSREPRQNVAGASEPGDEGGERAEIQFGAAVRGMVAVGMNMQRPRDERERADHESEYEACQKKCGQRHAASLECKTSNNRSASPGFSRIKPISVRQRRESGWRAIFNNALQTSGSL